MHLHVHVIPRYRGDMDDPRGGVRHVIPSKGNYLAATAPAHTDDASFIETLLTLLDHAQLTSTYKLAVLLALVDLCLEHATESGAAPSSVTTRQLAEKVLALYWPQTAPFGETAAVLRQNAGSEKGARVLRLIEEFRVRAAGDPTAPLARARATAPVAFEALVREVEWTMILMPLPRVQVLPGGQEHRFLYDIAWSVHNPLSPSAFRRDDFDNLIRFKPGAAERLVSMAGVIRPAVQRRWAQKVARLNDALVQDARLDDFLFGAPRASLAAVRGPLVELHAGRCFYCDHRLAREVEVDHFIAWSRHPENAVENLGALPRGVQRVEAGSPRERGPRRALHRAAPGEGRRPRAHRPARAVGAGCRARARGDARDLPPPAPRGAAVARQGRLSGRRPRPPCAAPSRVEGQRRHSPKGTAQGLSAERRDSKPYGHAQPRATSCRFDGNSRRSRGRQRVLMRPRSGCA